MGCPPVDLSDGECAVDPESWKQGFFKGATSFHERAVPGHLSPSVQADIAMRNLNAPSSLDAAGISNIPPNTDRISQVISLLRPLNASFLFLLHTCPLPLISSSLLRPRVPF